MRIISRRKAVVFFLSLGVCLAVFAAAVGFGWIILNWREGLKVFLGVLFFGAITTGLILNTIFLIREIRRNEQHDSFINAVTHELKTPIASIRLYLETLQRREVSDAQRQDFYRLMLLDSNRLLGTVEQVLKAGRASDRRSPLQVDLIDFASLVAECVNLARERHHLSAQGIHFDPSSLNGQGSAVKGDADELRTAVFNVLDNAIKYSADNVDVSVRLLSQSDRLVLRVEDRGIGIPGHELKRVFKRFYRVPHRSMAQVKGTGLGLFIVRAIARRHGGKVYAHSEGEGRGTTITLELPRSAAL
ncbi:MAG: HAMP domain-containing histidine kinase [Acidobacteria bacterium]|nr:HAMP domain-containing histidine kinase [Acidobacteriota bacterium]MBV9481136.1 HAMP domain-containing histidine kinase [Acidobacteriota bacterium]